MSLPAAPLPSVGAIFRALTAAPSKGDLWADGHQCYVTRVYRRGSFALAEGVEAVRKATEEKKVTVWVPGYFCNEALQLLRTLRVTVRFYPIQENLAPDWPILEYLVAHESIPQVFILVHYFGFPNVTKEARDFCDRHRIVLLEDAAHVLLPYPSMGLGDLLVFSPRKLLAIPSGGILVISTELAKYLGNGWGNGQVGETIRWLGRGLAQKILVRLYIPWHHVMAAYHKGRQAFNKDAEPLETQGRCSLFALRLLSVMEHHMTKFIERRRHYYWKLLEWSSKLVQVRPLFSNLPDGVCPYAFPLLVNRGSEDAVAKLQSSGIPASRWPDLPPEVLANEGEYKMAIQVYKQLMLLPVHQSLTPRQIDMIGKRLRVVHSGSL